MSTVSVLRPKRRPSSSTQQAPNAKPSTQILATQRAMLAEVNKIRRAYGKSPLEIGTKVMLNAAIAHSVDQAKRNQMDHKGFQQRARISRASRENVGLGPESVREMVDIWKRSPGHLTNILAANKNVVLGVAKNKNGQPYWTMLLS